jgi:hypothetical protein
MVGGDGRACARVGSRGPAARRSMSHRWHQTSVRVFFPRGEECVNEFPRVSRLKLFSYAVAALSNFFGPPSGSHGSSPGVNCRTVTVAGVRVRNTDAEGARTLSGRAGGHKVIGPGPISAIVLNGPRYVAAHVAPCSESLDTVRYRSVAVSVLLMTWLRWCSRSEALETAPLEPWQSRFVLWSWYRRLLQIGGRLLRLSRMAPP